MTVPLDFVRGDATGLIIPAHAEALRAAGEGFLTEAFRNFGSISPDNRIDRLTRAEPLEGGNSGQKLLLSVEYAHWEPGLHTNLFVKFSRDFTDAFRDRRRHEWEAEVRFATMSRIAGFPINVPAACFADFHRESGTGILITQRIAFGSDGIEPLLSKCMDHNLAEPLAYYAAFAADCPQLLPSHLTAPQFITRLEHEAVRFLRHEAAIKRFLQAERDFIALSRYNANIDNAWFWRDAHGALQCGLLDWGRVRQMNVAYALWGCLCAASADIWESHLDELLALFIDELHARGGPRLDVAELTLHLHFYVATMGLAALIDAPRLVLARLPEAAGAYGPLDPVFRKDEVARGFLHVFTAFLNFWQTHDFGASLDRLLERDGARVN